MNPFKKVNSWLDDLIDNLTDWIEGITVQLNNYHDRMESLRKGEQPDDDNE